MTITQFNSLFLCHQISYSGCRYFQSCAFVGWNWFPTQTATKASQKKILLLFYGLHLETEEVKSTVQD